MHTLIVYNWDELLPPSTRINTRLFHLPFYLEDLSIWLHVDVNYSFSLLCKISLSDFTTNLFIHLFLRGI